MSGGSGRSGDRGRWRSNEGRQHAGERRRQEAARAEVDRKLRETADEDAITVAEQDEADVRVVPGPTELGGVLGELVRARGWEHRLRAARLEDHWSAVVGEQLAARSRPGRLEGGVLQVIVGEPRWATQLQYLADQIVGRVAAETGIEVRRVNVVVGNLDRG